MNKENNVVLNFKMDGQIEYAKTLRDINAIMNAAASEYRTHVAAMGKDADQTQKLAAEKKKLEVQLEAGQERTKRLRAEYEAMAKDTRTTTGQLADKHRQLQNSERAEIALSNALERVNEGLSEQAIESRKAEEALNELESESEDLERQTEKLNAEYELQKAQLGENASESDKLKLKMDHLNDTHELAEEKVKNYEEQLEQAKLQYGENSAEVDQYEVQLLEARTAEQELANEIDATNRQLEEQAGVLYKVGESLEKAGKKMTDTGKTLSKRVTAPVMGAAAAAAKIGSDFEAGMSQVQAISGATGDDLEELTLKAREVGAETMFSASEAAEALNYMALAGWDTHQMLDGIDGVMSLAAASGEDLAQTSDIVTDSLSAFKMEVSESSRLADVLAAASANANTDVSGLGAAFQYVAPVAGSLGYTIEDTAHAIGLMSDNGIKGQKAGTALRTMMTNLAKPTAAMEDAMEDLGLSLTDSEDNMKDFDTIMKELQVSFADLSEAEQASAAATIFGKEAMSGALAIIGTSTEDYNKLGDAIKNSSGSAEEMAEVMQDNLQGRLKEAQSAMEEAAITVYDNLQPALETIVSGIKQAADWFNELSPSIQNTIIIVAGLAAALGPVLIVLGMLISSIVTVAGALSSIGGAIALLFNPITLIVAAVAGLIAIFVRLYNSNKEFRDGILEIWERIKEGFSIALEFIKDIVYTIITNVTEFFSEQLSKIREFWDENGQQIMDLVELYFGIIWENIEMVMGWIKGIFQTVWPIIQAVVKTTWEYIKMIVKNGIDFVLGIINTILSILRGDWEAAWDSIKETVESIWDNIKTFFTNVDLVQTGKDIIQGLINGIGSMIGAVRDAVSNIGTKIMDTFTGFFKTSSPSRLTMGTGKDIGAGVGIGLEDEADDVADKAKGMAGLIYDAFNMDLPQVDLTTVNRPSNLGTTRGYGGTTSNEYNYQTLNMDGIFNGAVFHVRDDNDIPRIAKELNDYIKKGARKRGVTIP